MPLIDDDLRHLTAAQGYCELGMFMDADEELEEIDAEVRHIPEVLEVRVQIYRALNDWESMQTVAKKLTEYDRENPRWPILWAFATRRADSITAAKRILLEVWNRHEKEPTIAFNLACYECQLGHLDLAKEFLKVAISLDSRMRVVALDDEDLKPLWDVI